VIRGEVLDSVAEVDAVRDAWDQLATALGKPYCAPGWMLAWWRHIPRPGARLRVVVVRDGTELVGVTPFFAQRLRGGIESLGLLGAGVAARIDPLAEPGQERNVAAVAARALCEQRPHPALIAFEGADAALDWPHLFAEAWPGALGAQVRRLQVIPAPVVRLDCDGFDTWLAAKSSNFRQQMRRNRRTIEARGAVFRHIDGPQLGREIARFADLHRRRLSAKGQTTTLDGGVEEMLREASLDLAARDRMWISRIEVDGELICDQLFVAAGEEVSYWNGGFDGRWAAYRPGLLSLLAAVEDAFARGAARLDLGAGAQDYKYRFAGTEDRLVRALVLPRGRWYPVARAFTTPAELRARLRRRPPRQLPLIRRMLPQR
jgi:CelD/BcsL family acetyltransferase involved in cellulose biosynthesis